MSSILWYKRRGTFIDSCSRSDGIKVPCCTQRCRLTRAMASAKEGLVLSYHAAVRGAMPPRCSIRISAASVTTLNRPKSAGVVRAMARSDHWRWVSRPRCPASTIFAGWRQSVLPVHLLSLTPLLGSVGPVAGDVKLQDDGVVHDPVNRRGGGHGVGKDALPLREDQV